MPSRRYVVFPQGGGKPAPGAYNAATDVTRLRRQSRTFGDSIVQTQRSSYSLSPTANPPSGGGGGGGRLTILQYLQSLMGGKGVLSGHHWDQFNSSVLDQFLTTGAAASPFPQTAAPTLPNISPRNVPISGGVGAASNTNKIPAVLGMWPNTLGMIADTITRSASLTLVNQAISLGFIPFLTWVTGSPANPSSFAGQLNEFGSSGVLVANSTIQNTFFTFCDDLAAFINSCNGTAIIRPFVEMNLNYPGGSSGNGHWYCTNGGNANAPTNAQFIALWKLTLNRIHITKGVPRTKIIWCYAPSLFSGSFSANYAAPDINGTYVDVAGPDTYINTGTTMTQSSFNSTLMGASGSTVSFFEGLGLPIFFPECGGGEPEPANYTTNSALFGAGIQSALSNFVCSIFWPQQWGMSYQLNASGYFASTINYDKLPVFA